MNAVTLNNARRDLDRLIQRTVADAEPTIICNDAGEKVVLLSLDEYNSWEETLYLLSNPANSEHLRQSISEARSGKTTERELVEP